MDMYLQMMVCLLWFIKQAFEAYRMTKVQWQSKIRRNQYLEDIQTFKDKELGDFLQALHQGDHNQEIFWSSGYVVLACLF